MKDRKKYINKDKKTETRKAWKNQRKTDRPIKRPSINT